MFSKFFSKISTWYFTKRALPYWCILLIDGLFIVFVSLLVFLFDRGHVTLKLRLWDILSVVGVYLVPTFVSFRLFHTYSGIIRYSSFIDLQRVGFAMGAAFLAVTLIYFAVPWPLQREIFAWNRLLVISLLSTSMMWILRIGIKFLYDVGYRKRNTMKVFVYGIFKGGVSIAKSINNMPNSAFSVAGFITEDRNIHNYRLMGVRVWVMAENMTEIMVRHGAAGIIISPLYNEKFRNETEFIDKLIAAGIRIYMFHEMEEWDGKSELLCSSFREVNVEDLLPRKQVWVDMERIREQLFGRRILITGAAGSIGKEIVRQSAEFAPSELLLVDQAETPMHDLQLMMAETYPDIPAKTVVTSITNPTHMEYLFAQYRPEYVFHAAAYKHVPMMEDNPAQSVQNNVRGTRIVADLAVKYGTAKFVMVSTDKAVNPTNVMGCSKRICEIYIQSLDRAVKEGRIKGVTRFVTTRFGNVLGSNGSVVPLFREQIRCGGPVKVTHPDIERYFMLISEACRLVLEAGTMGKGGEIFAFDMGKPVRIADLARRMIRLSGTTPIEIVYTGLRDGEKLYEDVLNDAELTRPTINPKIILAEAREYDYSHALTEEERLYRASFGYDDMAIVRIMKEIVPEYRSRHSKYEVLDQARD